MSKALLWFRNDLRMHDNEALKLASENEKIFPVYCFDPRQWGKTSFGFPKTGVHRTRFLMESVQNLQSRLQKAGANLAIRLGKPEDILPDLVEKYGIDKILAHKEVTAEEVNVENAVSDKSSAKVKFCWGSTLYHPDDIPYAGEDIPKIFTNFRKQVEKKSEVREMISAPKTLRLVEGFDPGELPEPEELGLDVEQSQQDSRAVIPFKGDEQQGMNRLNHYFWEKDQLKNYKYTRNQLLGADYSSKFSAWLANGSLSPRKIYWEVNKYEQERVENVSTYWMIFELIWRDFFRFSALKYGNRFFSAGGIQGKDRDWSYERSAFQKWADAETGIPFIDANMRELNQTGYMSNRGRQNVASFLAQNLNIDWRMGAEYFESLLIDYDVCSNYGNWMYNATVGQDPRNRYFNIINQAEKYDSDGEYVKLWLPELEKVPAEHIHEPYKLGAEEQKKYGVIIGKDYPEPMIDLDKSYEEIRSRGF